MDELVAAAEANYFAAWKLLSAEAPSGVVEETDEVVFTSVGSPVAYFNSAFVKPPADPATLLDTIRRFFDKLGVPYTVRLRDDHSHAAIAACEREGLHAAGESPLMVARVADISPPAPDLDIRAVGTTNWNDHVATIASGFGLPLDLLGVVVGPSLLSTGMYAACTAYDGDTATSTAALIATDDVAGIYNVATPDGFRRRGLGEAVTRAAVAEGGRRGCSLTTLQASEMGYPIYERMGYRTVVQWRSFIA
jgi:GNAT superfamily N-acetyltransferase